MTKNKDKCKAFTTRLNYAPDPWIDVRVGHGFDHLPEGDRSALMTIQGAGHSYGVHTTIDALIVMAETILENLKRVEP
jgi:hypothetical protein